MRIDWKRGQLILLDIQWRVFSMRDVAGRANALSSAMVTIRALSRLGSVGRLVAEQRMFDMLPSRIDLWRGRDCRDLQRQSLELQCWR